jgi:hypothetical protein
MFKIQLQNGEFYKNKSARVQHYKSNKKAAAKIEKLGEIAIGAIVVESKARTTTAKIDKIEEKTDVKAVKAKKKAASKPEKPDKSTNIKTKKNKN